MFSQACVKNSVHRGSMLGGEGACVAGGVWQRGAWQEGSCMAGGMCGWGGGVAWQGARDLFNLVYLRTFGGWSLKHV